MNNEAAGGQDGYVTTPHRAHSQQREVCSEGRCEGFILQRSGGSAVSLMKMWLQTVLHEAALSWDFEHTLNKYEEY